MDAVITLQELVEGKDQKMSESLTEMICATWTGHVDLANAAVVTFKTSVHAQGQTVVVSIQPEYYLHGDNNRKGLTKKSGFCIGSVTKAFTGIMLAWRIIHDNAATGDNSGGQGGGQTLPNYNLHAPVNQWLPDDAKRSTRRISTTTLGQLASMSSCLIRDLADHTTEEHGLYNGNADPGGVTPSPAQPKSVPGAMTATGTSRANAFRVTAATTRIGER